MTLPETLAEIRDYSPWTLANAANCSVPDAPDSAGSKFLVHVRDAVLEAHEYEPFTSESRDDTDRVHEIADAAPDVYTATLWAEFVDLAAYHEEPEYGEWPDDLNRAAAVALYQIAERLASALVDEITSAAPLGYFDPDPETPRPPSDPDGTVSEHHAGSDYLVVNPIDDAEHVEIMLTDGTWIEAMPADLTPYETDES